MEFKVQQGILQAIIDYLATKPYNEVVGLLNALQQVKPIEDKKEDGIPIEAVH